MYHIKFNDNFADKRNKKHTKHFQFMKTASYAINHSLAMIETRIKSALRESQRYTTLKINLDFFSEL